MSHAPCSYGQDMIDVECEHKPFILYGSHLLVHTKMNSQLPCKMFRKLNKSLLSTLITKCGAEMALSTTFAFSLGQAVPYVKSTELTLPAESVLEAVQSWRDFVSGAINLLFGQQDFTLLFPPARWMHLHVACCHAVSSSWEPGTWRSFPWKQKTLRAEKVAKANVIKIQQWQLLGQIGAGRVCPATCGLVLTLSFYVSFCVKALCKAHGKMLQWFSTMP